MRNREKPQILGSNVADYKWYFGWVLEVDFAYLPAMVTVLVPVMAVQSAHPAPGKAMPGAVRKFPLLSDDIDFVGSKVKQEKQFNHVQCMARTADVAVPPPPPCLPYTEVANEAFIRLVKQDAQSPPKVVAAAAADTKLAIVPAASRSVANSFSRYGNYDADEEMGAPEEDFSGKDPRDVMLEKRRFYTEGAATTVSRWRTVSHSRAAGSAPPGVCGLENLGNTVRSAVPCWAGWNPSLLLPACPPPPPSAS